MSRAESLKRPIWPGKTSAHGALIDIEHLSKQTLGDEGLELEVLRLFDEMSHVYYERLEQSTSAADLLRNLHAYWLKARPPASAPSGWPSWLGWRRRSCVRVGRSIPNGSTTCMWRSRSSRPSSRNGSSDAA